MASEKKIPVSLDKAGFEDLFKKFFPSLTHFGMKYVTDKDTAKEIVHDVFLNLWNKRNTLDSSSSLKSYLFTSVYNRCMNYIRDQRKFNKDDQVLNIIEQETQEIPYDHLEAMELESRIFEALNSLPLRCKEIFMLSRFEEKSYAEIAEQLSLSVKTVETQMSKALRILRVKLSDYL